jgi:hypothetical protein
MTRTAAVALLPAVLFLMTATPAHAQFPPPGAGPRMGDEIVGDYVNKSGGGECYVTRSGRGYTFVNERGSRARFVFVSNDRLEQTSGEWDPRVVATVSRDRFGRIIIRFDAPRTRTGFWTMTN